MNINTIPEHHVINNYYSYIMSYWFKAANKIQKEIGVEDLPNGLTPDVVRANSDYRMCMSNVNVARLQATRSIPCAKKLKIIHSEYSKLYDMGQRIKISKMFKLVENNLLDSHESIASFREYMIKVNESFMNFEV